MTGTRRQLDLPIQSILVLALLSAVAPLATDMYLPAFPTLAAEMDVSAAVVQMTLTSFLVGLAGGQLVIGPLSDRYGRRSPLLIGTAIAIVSGFLCIVAPNVETLVALRFLQGLGGAAGVVSARAIIVDSTGSAAAAARLFQIMMLIGGLAPALSPIIGSGIAAFVGWRGVFAVMAFLSLVSFIGALRVVKETLPPDKRTEAGLGALGRGILTVLGNRVYVGCTLTVGFAFMVMFGYISASPFVFQEVLGLSPVQFSLAFGLNALGVATVGAISAKLVGRISPQRLALVGLGILILGAGATLTSVLAGVGWQLMLPSIFMTVTPLGMVFGNASALAIAQVPRNAGLASALLGASQFCMGAVASPLVGLAGKQSALPMALVMVCMSLMAALCFILIALRSLKAAAQAKTV